jgi:hypothetical protein
MAPKPRKVAEQSSEPAPTENLTAPGEVSTVPAVDPAAEAAALVENSASPDADAIPPLAPGAETPTAEPPPEAPFGYYKKGRLKGQPRTAPLGQRQSPPDARMMGDKDARAAAVVSAAPQIDNAGLAAMINGTFFLVTVALIGEDGKPSPEEAAQINDTLAKYLAYKNVQPSPELALAACYCGFVVMRLTRPTVREKAIGWWAVIKSKFSRSKKRADLHVVEPQKGVAE